MKYIRVKTTYMGNSGAQIHTEQEFKDLLKYHDFVGALRQGFSFQISIVKKSPLLTSKTKS